VVGDPNSVNTASMGHWNVFGAHYAFEDYLQVSVALNPLDVLPSEVVSDLMDERFLFVIIIPHLEIISKLIKKLKSYFWPEDCALISPPFTENFRVNSDSKCLEI
jgi:hypothetical protein